MWAQGGSLCVCGHAENLFFRMGHYGYLEFISNNLQMCHHLQSSAAHAIGYSDCLVVLFENSAGEWARYDYLSHGQASFLVLKDAFSFGSIFRQLQVRWSAFDKYADSLMFQRPFGVFEVDESVHPSLRFDNKVEVSFAEGAYHNYVTTAMIEVVIDHSQFIMANHGACEYTVSVYALDGLKAQLFLVPAVEPGPGEQEITLFARQELYGDLEVSIRCILPG